MGGCEGRGEGLGGCAGRGEEVFFEIRKNFKLFFLLRGRCGKKAFFNTKKICAALASVFIIFREITFFDVKVR